MTVDAFLSHPPFAQIQTRHPSPSTFPHSHRSRDIFHPRSQMGEEALRISLLSLPSEIKTAICGFVREQDVVYNEAEREIGKDHRLSEWHGRGVSALFMSCVDLKYHAAPFLFQARVLQPGNAIGVQISTLIGGVALQTLRSSKANGYLFTHAILPSYGSHIRTLRLDSSHLPSISTSLSAVMPLPLITNLELNENAAVALYGHLFEEPSKHNYDERLVSNAMGPFIMRLKSVALRDFDFDSHTLLMKILPRFEVVPRVRLLRHMDEDSVHRELLRSLVSLRGVQELEISLAYRNLVFPAPFDGPRTSTLHTLRLDKIEMDEDAWIFINSLPSLRTLRLAISTVDECPSDITSSARDGKFLPLLQHLDLMGEAGNLDINILPMFTNCPITRLECTVNGVSKAFGITSFSVFASLQILQITINYGRGDEVAAAAAHAQSLRTDLVVYQHWTTPQDWLAFRHFSNRDDDVPQSIMRLAVLESIQSLREEAKRIDQLEEEAGKEETEDRWRELSRIMHKFGSFQALKRC